MPLVKISTDPRRRTRHTSENGTKGSTSENTRFWNAYDGTNENIGLGHKAAERSLAERYIVQDIVEVPEWSIDQYCIRNNCQNRQLAEKRIRRAALHNANNKAGVLDGRNPNRKTAKYYDPDTYWDATLDRLVWVAQVCLNKAI